MSTSSLANIEAASKLLGSAKHDLLMTETYSSSPAYLMPPPYASLLEIDLRNNTIYEFPRFPDGIPSSCSSLRSVPGQVQEFLTLVGQKLTKSLVSASIRKGIPQKFGPRSSHENKERLRHSSRLNNSDTGITYSCYVNNNKVNSRS
ncbi:hypothetical protein JOQ06_004285 [Pogonophryne albipinna]|uniref:Uncharacterized protein n=1 Tax=Pogonophryne albipinna TaxID=1090488 RepID=A0AAD6APS8_9TELE|nr:hypothetical protein JOQ06_004285 [Pogonophryne albipinna]